jgi:hypothetical protein
MDKGNLGHALTNGTGDSYSDAVCHATPLAAVDSSDLSAGLARALARDDPYWRCLGRYQQLV